MANGEKCSCTGAHFCSGVSESVIEVIAVKSGQTREQARSQAFSGDWGGGHSDVKHAYPAQVTYRALLNEKVLRGPAGEQHVEVAQPLGVQPLGSATGPVIE